MISNNYHPKSIRTIPFVYKPYYTAFLMLKCQSRGLPQGLWSMRSMGGETATCITRKDAYRSAALEPFKFEKVERRGARRLR